MRGKAVQKMWATDHQRITPAYAGKSTKNTCCCCVSEDHPRLCGEKYFFPVGFLIKSGSPPPMRGKADSSAQAEESSRITPAYAGKSRTVCGIRSKLEDHPRLCGEKLDAVTVLISTLGSPPPMRGKAVSGQSPPTRYRITPAYAGKRQNMNTLKNAQGDHPRLCGEKLGCVLCF